MKIEIMELLHKIYNLDDMPGKIIFDNCVWRYCSEFQDYQSERGYLFGDYMSHINETVKFLNAEVEIIEEEKEIEKIGKIYDGFTDSYYDTCLETAIKKVDELVDEINKLKKEKNMEDQ